MSYYPRHNDHINVGDFVRMEVKSEALGEDYTYEVSGKVRKYQGVKAVGLNGIGEGKILEHIARALPTAFASHVRYPCTGEEWVKTSDDYWRSSDGVSRKAKDMNPDWVLVRDNGVK